MIEHYTSPVPPSDVLHPFGLRLRFAVALDAIGLILLFGLVYWIVRVVQARTLLGIANCPGCLSTDVRRTLDKGLSDGLLRPFGCLPYRCYGCGNRYFRAG